eukprot:3536546-Lingulodinium_polyedra.AAC.1
MGRGRCPADGAGAAARTRSWFVSFGKPATAWHATVAGGVTFASVAGAARPPQRSTPGTAAVGV